jgi:hypothetical protein
MRTGHAGGAFIAKLKYYLHDSNAFNDEKITQLFMEHGYEGLGLFYTLLEKLAAQEKPVNTLVLKRQLFVGKKLEKCWKFMESIGIIHSNNGETFNKQLMNYAHSYEIKKEKTAERLRQWREKQEVTKNVTHSEHVRNASKVNRSKENKIEVKLIEEFTEFWNLYDKKIEYNKSLKKFTELPEDVRAKIFFHVPKYKEAQPEKKFRKNPLTYLNNECWNDEIIKSKLENERNQQLIPPGATAQKGGFGTL